MRTSRVLAEGNFMQWENNILKEFPNLDILIDFVPETEIEDFLHNLADSLFTYFNVDIKEKLAELEHEQWQGWVKNVIQDFLTIIEQSKDNQIVFQTAKDRILRWQRNQIKYSELPQEIKEQDRIWADKVLEILAKARTQATSKVVVK